MPFRPPDAPAPIVCRPRPTSHSDPDHGADRNPDRPHVPRPRLAA
ncbi:hypothetical protein [Streptomyces cinereoruber]